MYAPTECNSALTKDQPGAKNLPFPKAPEGLEGLCCLDQPECSILFHHEELNRDPRRAQVKAYYRLALN